MSKIKYGKMDLDIVNVLEKHIKEYDVFTDGDERRVNSMKNCVNELCGYIVYKEIINE